MTTSIKDKMRKVMSDRGFYNLSPEQRIKENQECNEKLSKITKFNYEGVKKLYREMRGGGE